MAQSSIPTIHKDTPDLPTNCNECGDKFSISLILYCQKVSLVTTLHNKLHDRVGYLASMVFTLLHMRNISLIYPGFFVQEGKEQPSRLLGSYNPPALRGKTEHKGDLLIRNLQQRGVGSIHNMRVVDAENLYYQKKTPEKCLLTEEKEKTRSIWRSFYIRAAIYPPLSSASMASQAWRRRQ